MEIVSKFSSLFSQGLDNLYYLEFTDITHRVLGGFSFATLKFLLFQLTIAI